MRSSIVTPALTLCLLAAACSGNPPANTARQNSTSNTASATEARSDSTSGAGAPSVASSHGGGDSAVAPSGASATEKAPVETPELDAKVEKAEAKAKASGASAADKQAAAAARMERGNFYYNSQDKRLYRYALGDFRHALRYEPGNAEAKEKIEMIESIYKSLGRPVPTNGLEP